MADSKPHAGRRKLKAKSAMLVKAKQPKSGVASVQTQEGDEDTGLSSAILDLYCAVQLSPTAVTESRSL